MITTIKRHLLTEWHRVILFMMPLLITLINPNWIYNPPVLNNVDTWIYNGLFRYFFDFADSYPSNLHYFIERLSAILPGYALYHVFTPEVANAVLHLGVYMLTVFALYGVMRRLFDKDTAFIAALCLGGYTWFLRAAGHDYIDGMGIAYYSAALWFATQAAYQIRYKIYLLGCGAFLGAALISQLFLVVFVPIIGLYYLALNWKNHRHPFIMSAIYVSGGAAILIFGLMLFNLITVGELNIFSNSLGFIRQTATIVTLRSSIFEIYGSTPMTWMVLPCLLMLCSVMCLARWKHIPAESRFGLRLVIVTFILTLGVLILLHYMTSFAYLVIYLYMSLMIPALFLLFGGLIATISPSLNLRQGVMLLGVMLIPFALSVFIPTLEAALLDVRFVWAITGGAMVILAAGLLRTRKPLWIVGAFAAMSLMFSGHNGVAYYDRLYTYGIFMTTSDTLNIIDSQNPYPLNFSQYIVLEATDKFSNSSLPLRGISQPIHFRSLNWASIQYDPQRLKWYQATVQRYLLLSDHETILDELTEKMGNAFDIQVNHSFGLTEIDPSGAYRGYMLTLTRLDRYGEPVFASGDNVNRPTTVTLPLRAVGWTGPGSDVILKFNLPAPKGDVMVEICGVLATTVLDDVLPALVNQTPVTFTRQPSIGDCFERYTANIPQAIITGEGITEIALTIPVALPDDRVVEGQAKDLYGLALTLITFFDEGQP